jgi:hypothetical protein
MIDGDTGNRLPHASWDNAVDVKVRDIVKQLEGDGLVRCAAAWIASAIQARDETWPRHRGGQARRRCGTGNVE